MSINRSILKPHIFIFFILIRSLFAQEPDDLFNMSFEDLLSLEVTTASKSMERLADAASTMTVVTREELLRFGGTTLKDILVRVPNLNLSSAYFTDRTIIAARGAQIKVNSGHVLLLINGRPVREVVEGGVGSEIYTTFPVHIIERLEVIRGPGSVLYGSNAFSAVINIITRTSKGLPVTIIASGSESSLYTSATVAYAKGDFNVISSGQYNQNPELETLYKYRDPDSHTISNKNITAPGKGPGFFLDIGYHNLRLMTGYYNYLSGYFNHGITGQNTLTKNFYDIGYKHNISAKWHMDFNLTRTQASFKTDDSPLIERDSNDWVAEWTNTIEITDHMRWLIGGLVNRAEGTEKTNYYGPTETISDESRNSFGFYSQIDYQTGHHIKWIGGMQANKVKNMDIDVVPRAGVIWYPASHINIKLLYSQAFRAPSINELGLDFDLLKGNPELLPEKTENTDLGINLVYEKFQLGVNFFHSKMSDIIYPDRSTSPNIYRNEGNIHIQGFESEFKYFINDVWFLTGSLLYQDNEDKDTGSDNITPIANLGAKAGISYRSRKGITIGVFNSYQGPLNDYFKTTLNPNPGAYNLASLYARVHLTQLLNWPSQPLTSLFIQADNLFDEILWLPDLGGVEGESIPVLPGRTVYAGIRITF